MNVVVDRELFHQMMRKLSGKYQEPISTVLEQAIERTAGQLASATAEVRDGSVKISIDG